MSSIGLALQITLVGMGLVFAALILLWLMMALLTSLTADKASAPSSAEPVPIMDHDNRARAAAVAVAIALAQAKRGVAHPLADPPTAIVSAWQLGMRTRQLSQKGQRIKREYRKIG